MKKFLVSGLMASIVVTLSVPGLMFLLAPEEKADALGDVSRLARRVDALERRLHSLSSTPWLSGDPEEVVDRAVVRALEARAHRKDQPTTVPADVQGTDAAAGDKAAETVSALLDVLSDPSTSLEERDDVWEEIQQAGLLAAATAELEERVKRNPADPLLRVGLGKGYLHRLAVAATPREKANWANQADQAFDAALQLDDEHWEARFSKAVTLSFWPALYGKRAQAMRQFELLLSQQERESPRPEFAQTYLLLGNLYLLQGEREKARAVWSRGIQLYSEDESLWEKMRSLDS